MCLANHPATVPTSFRKMGAIAESLSYAHLHLTIDLEEIFTVHRLAKTTANSTLVLLSKHIGADDAIRLAPFFESLIKSFEPTDNMMEVLTVIFVPEGVSPQQLDILIRNKRQLGVAFLAVSTIFNTGMSIYNTYQISQLMNRQDHLETGLTRVVEVLRQEDKSLEMIKGSIIAYNETLVNFGKQVKKLGNNIDILTAYSLIHSKVESANLEFQLFATGLLELMNGRLSPLLVHKKNILATFEKFRSKIVGEGYHLIYDFPSSIFKADISYVTNGKVIDVFIHCPMVKMNPIPLYQYLSLPILLNSSVAGPLMFVESREDNDLLMIDTETQRGVELKTSFLAGCNVAKLAVGNVYMCSDRVPILKRDTTTDCLGLLFTGSLDQEKLLQTCNIMFSSRTVYARQVDKKTFLIYSKEQTKLTIFCERYGKTNISYVEGIHLIEVNLGCQADMDGNLMYGQSSGIDFEAGNLIHLPSKLTFTNDIFPVTELFDVYKSLKKIHLPEKVDFRNLDAWSTDQSWRYQASTFGTIGSVFLTSAIIGVIMYLLYAYYKYRRSQPATSPQVQEQEMHLVQRED